MKIKYFVACAALLGAAQLCGPAAPCADEDIGVLAAHPMPLYPGSVAAKDDSKLARYSKDDLATVRKFFEGKLRSGDRLEPFTADGETGFTVIYAKKAGKREQTAFELRVAARTEKNPPHQAFGELSAQVTRDGSHQQPEFDALQKEYGDIDSAYFRDEAAGILKDADKTAHPDADKLKAAGRKSKVSAEDKADAKEFKKKMKKMKELKAQGDIAGMMALAQSNKKFQSAPAGMAGAAEMAAEDRNRDTWDIWVKCLKDTKAAAYRTRLEYAAEALK